MKKVLHIAKYYPPCYGGIEQVTYDIVSGLHKRGYEQKVICFNDHPETFRDLYEGVDVTRVGFKLRLFSQPVTVSYFFILKKLFVSFKPDIVHVHLPNPLIATYVLKLLPKKTKLVLHWHSDIIRQRVTRFLYKPLESAILRRSEVIIAATTYHVDFSSSIKKFKNKISIIPFCIDTAKFESIKTAERQPKRLFFLGRHVPYKGLTYLIEAAKFIDGEAEIIVGGEGPLTGPLRKQAENLANIKFTGTLTHEQVLEYLMTSSVFLFPSITRNEAFGIAMIEAMYCGLPVVSFAIPGSGVNWVNQHKKTGMSVENKNVRQFADAVNLLLADKPLYAELSKNARAWALEHFQKEHFIGSIVKVYEEQGY